MPIYLKVFISIVLLIFCDELMKVFHDFTVLLDMNYDHTWSWCCFLSMWRFFVFLIFSHLRLSAEFKKVGSLLYVFSVKCTSILESNMLLGLGNSRFIMKLLHVFCLRCCVECLYTLTNVEDSTCLCKIKSSSSIGYVLCANCLVCIFLSCLVGKCRCRKMLAFFLLSLVKKTLVMTYEEVWCVNFYVVNWCLAECWVPSTWKNP